MKMIKVTAAVVLLLQISQGLVQSGWTFLIYNAHKKRCMGDNLQKLDECDPQNPRQQFRWTSENCIFNVAEKKCLSIDGKSEGSKLQLSICDVNSDLQKWECQSNSLFGLKNMSLYLSVQDHSNVLILSKDPGEKGMWTIHGTKDGVCSNLFEEIYTLKGNAFGRPCYFPFLYNNKWYSDCTTDGRSSNLSWCAIEQDYEPNQLWGYCPYQEIVLQLWRKNPLTDIYYQINEDSALTWYQARKSCQQQGGDLLSITEPHEQTFISGLTQKTGPVLWTGMNSLDALRGWHWVNGQPLRYLKWMNGQPSSLPGNRCGVLSQLYGSEWSTAICSERHGYICQRGLPTPTVPTVVHTGSCSGLWIPYSGHCYLLSHIKKPWMEAKDSCRHEGGDLLSILSVEEQSFIISQLGYSKKDEVWIGLNDLQTLMLFEWSDESNVLFTLWDVDEPSRDDDPKENCVVIKGEEGKWAHQDCQNKYGFICKKKKHTDPSTSDIVVTSPGCRPGLIRFGSSCYLAGSETKTFEDAKQTCEKIGSFLADITNRVENAFLVSLIGAKNGHFWIGLSNQENVHIFEWTNTKKVLFTHFNAGMPGGRQGCVALTTGILAGLWDVLSCTNAEKYICKQQAEGVTTTPAPPVTPTPRCSAGWKPVPDRDLCFKLFDSGREAKKTWFEALDFCRDIGGDLLSVHGPSYFDGYSVIQHTWIGYSIQDPSVGYTWSDGSSSSYESWHEGEPDDLNNVEKCAATTYTYWSNKDGQWRDLQCEDRLDWFCEIQKGVTPKEINITRKTYNTTEDGWIIFKGSQYYIYKDDYVPMVRARSFCKHRHADLVVINDEEERLFLWQQIKEESRYFYIGMNVDLDKSLSWMDRSPVVFQAWSKNEPTLLYGEEQCVAITSYQGLWKSVNCGLKIRFICKRGESVPAHVTAAPTEPPTGSCDHDWVKLEKQCFKIGLDLKTWDEARSYCRTNRGDLASIINDFQQAFLTLMMDEGTPDLWLGFNKLADTGFRWTDGSPVLYTAWWKFNDNDGSCVAMASGSNTELGRWVRKDCSNTSGYICSRAIDPLITPSPTEMSKTFRHGNSSYMVIQLNQTWKEAQSHCRSLGANLASIRDAITQSYIAVQAHNLKQPLWIGLNSMETYRYFLWVDNHQLNMERWAPKEPMQDRPCVYLDVDGTWKTSLCNKTFYSVCKQSTDVPPTQLAQFPGVCPNQIEEYPRMIWLPYRGHCYAFVYGRETWYTASRTCMTKGADLLSIVDSMESTFISNHLKIFGNDYSLFWIGLFQNKKGQWLWHDESMVSYLNWDDTAEEFTDDHYESYDIGWSDGSDCAVILTATGQWEKRRCRYTQGPFICKKAKVMKLTTELTPTDVAAEGAGTHRSFSGVTVVVLTAGLCVLAGLVYGFYRTSRKQAATVERPMQNTSEVLLPGNNDTKVLVRQMEVNEEAPTV